MCNFFAIFYCISVFRGVPDEPGQLLAGEDRKFLFMNCLPYQRKM